MTVDTGITLSAFSNKPSIHNQLEHNSLLLKSRFYNVDITMVHWQLKDLICASSNSNNIYYPYDKQLMKLNFDDSNSIELTKFDTSPRCLKEKDGLIVIGAEINSNINNNNNNNSNNSNNISSRRGLFGLFNENTNYLENKIVGNLINNDVSIYKLSNNSYKSIICNNDQNLYLLDINNNGINSKSETKINLGMPLNHSSLSPDQKNLITVGDSPKIILLHPMEENLKNINSKTIISTNYDSGFSIDWNQSSQLFSVCFQEGINQIYDIRNTTHPIHEIYSTRKSQQNGAFRVTTFTKGTDDFLFISEHQGRIHMIDTRNFNNHTIILLPKQSYDKSTNSFNQPITKSYNEVLDLDFESSHTTTTPSSSTQLYHPQLPTHAHQTEHTLKNASSYNNNLKKGALNYNVQIQDDQYYLNSDLNVCGLSILNTLNDQNSVAIGTQDGLICWEIDSWKRRCFPSCQYA
ncbi:hypothetical protein CANARDRAFT_230630 [[Candida] arabinofermentans NRRL YB-2248]|uniref:DUF2415 domain-containing protein n=1 Tax=[Candida] arabinofermentans NRRL YB-2248 TaxID=983967 RepID=A0A1E4T4J4_9ASCO|nr:hypothetical protein CANARDRAFT_230630 [[Candida] arabinofermentans NRRL YB-2248]